MPPPWKAYPPPLSPAQVGCPGAGCPWDVLFEASIELSHSCRGSWSVSAALVAPWNTAAVGKGRRLRRNRAAERARQDADSDTQPPVRFQMPRPNVTTFTSLTMIPKFPPDHALGGADLPPQGSPGSYQVDAVLGVPGASRSAFITVDWEQIAAEGDSLLEIPGNAT